MATSTMQDWKITKDEYKTLVSYLGCGDFQKAKIVFFGIEEGTGGNGIEENVVARANLFGEFDNGTITSALKMGERENGYWEPNALLGGNKVRGIKGLPPVGAFLKGFYNPTIARISLELESPEEVPEYWFQGMNENLGAKKKIIERIGQLYQKDSESQLAIALTDWRPLPRPNENDWPSEYGGINKNLYLKAFDNPGSTQIYEDSFSNYTEDAHHRAQLLRNLLTTNSIPLIIGLGNIPAKKKLLENIFPGLHFESFPSNILPDHPGLKGFCEGSSHTQFFLLPFPDPKSRTWKSDREDLTPGKLSRLYYREVTQTQIRPIIRPFL
ncbi:hypothetical protein D3C73_873890 [compost metagenome]